MMIRQMWPWPKKRKSAFSPEQAPRRTSRPNQKGFDNICISRDSNLQNNDMRMVIMDYDSSRRSSKRVIYDSSTILPLISGEIIAPDTRLSECKKFRLLRKKKDVSNLAQLVWGSGPATHGMDALKFHHIHDDKLLISRVFPMPRSLNGDIYSQTESVTSSDSESQYTPTVRSMDTYGMNLRNSLSNTAPPEKFARVRNSSLNIESDESDEFRAFSPPHRLSKNRRIQMSHCSSLCEPVTSPLNIRKPRSRMSSVSSQMDDCTGSSSMGAQNEKQVALAIVFTSHQRTFVFQHIPLIEAEMARLECRIATAALYSKNFLDNVYRAWEEFNNSICMLFNAPRLRNPVWLSLAERETDEHLLAGEFCDQLAYLVDKLDTKECNYFLSNLVSTVLQTHLSWVASVASPNTNQDGDQRLFQNTVLNDEFASVPYNPHIAQYLEISGNVGTVNRSTKTVVFGNGEDADTIANLLQILSYFIRCSTVHASQKGREADPLPIFRSFSPEIIGSPISSTTSELGAFSPEKMKMEIEYEVPTGFMDPPKLLVNNVAKVGNVDSDDYLGRSLLAGPSTTFSPHFVISGLIRDGSNIDRAFERMCDEVRSSFEPSSRAVSSLSCSQASSLYEAPAPDCVIVMADVGDNSVKVLTSDGIGTAHTPSESVVSMFENFSQLHRVGTASKILISFLEDSLYSVLCKSLSLVELVSSEPELKGITQSHISSDRVRQIVGCEHSDLRLLVNVASVYYPCVMSSAV